VYLDHTDGHTGIVCAVVCLYISARNMQSSEFAKNAFGNSYVFWYGLHLSMAMAMAMAMLKGVRV
jgi:hypothetical protein